VEEDEKKSEEIVRKSEEVAPETADIDDTVKSVLGAKLSKK
jgi:hypothetical protein